MHANLSRLTYDRANGYSAVIALQGAVLMDADLNEGRAIQVDAMRTLIVDLVGPNAGPAAAAGFLVGPIVEGRRTTDLYVGPGRYYVHGICVEAGADDDGLLTRPTAYL